MRIPLRRTVLTLFVAQAASSAFAQPPAARGLTAVSGIKVGHHTLAERPTGCTVVLAEAGAVAGVDVRGGAPGTRETDLLDPVNMVQKVHAIVLAGGSAFGLDAAGGVMRYLESAATRRSGPPPTAATPPRRRRATRRWPKATSGPAREPPSASWAVPRDR